MLVSWKLLASRMNSTVNLCAGLGAHDQTMGCFQAVIPVAPQIVFYLSDINGNIATVDLGGWQRVWKCWQPAYTNSDIYFFFLICQ